MKFKNIMSGLVLLSLSGYLHAALECKFNSNDTLQIMSPGIMPTIVPLPPGSVAFGDRVPISSTAIMETTPALTSSCEVGNDGENVYMWTSASMEASDFNGKALFPTNIAGIFYTLAFYPDGNGVTAWFPSNAGSFVVTGDTYDNESIVKDKTWHVRMDFYQTNGYIGVPENVNYLTLNGGQVGQIVLGNPYTGDANDHPRPYVDLSQMSFNIPLDRPTCAVRAPNQVNLGDWTPAEVTNGTAPTVSFQIEGNCANTHIVKAEFKAQYTSSDNKYLLNGIQPEPGLTIATGVGVKVTSPWSISGLNFNQGWGEAIATDYINPVNTFTATYTATLVKYSSAPVTAGGFGSNVVVQMDYE